MPYLGWHGLVFLALCLCRSSRLDEAERALEEARTLLAAVAGGEWTLLDYLPAVEAELACIRQDYARAVAAADLAIERADAFGSLFPATMAWRVKAISSVRSGADPAHAQEMFDKGMQLCDAGGARAERAFSTLVWAQALSAAGHAARAADAVAGAKAQALRYGFDLRRCEWGAAALLEADAPVRA